jgi:hypothetical protein
MRGRMPLFAISVMLLISSAAAEAEMSSTNASNPMAVFELSCEKLTNYDAMHDANLANGWTYLGVQRSHIENSTALAAANSKNSTVNNLGPALGSVMGMLLTQGEHRRGYYQVLDGRKMLLKLTYVPTVDEGHNGQINCTVHAEAPEGMPSNAELIARIGRKPDEKLNDKRKEGKPVRLLWHDANTVRQFLFTPSKKPAETAGMVSYTIAILTNSVPADGDPDPPENPQPVPPETSQK